MSIMTVFKTINNTTREVIQTCKNQSQCSVTSTFEKLWHNFSS
jgi:hypothetical protein